MAELIGKGFVSANKGMKDADGYWNVSVDLTETQYYDDGTTKEETIAITAMDRDFQFAHELALRTAMYQLREEVYDRGFTSLIEARKSDTPYVASKTDDSAPTQ